MSINAYELSIYRNLTLGTLFYSIDQILVWLVELSLSIKCIAGDYWSFLSFDWPSTRTQSVLHRERLTIYWQYQGFKRKKKMEPWLILNREHLFSGTNSGRTMTNWDKSNQKNPFFQFKASEHLRNSFINFCKWILKEFSLWFWCISHIHLIVNI